MARIPYSLPRTTDESRGVKQDMFHSITGDLLSLPDQGLNVLIAPPASYGVAQGTKSQH